MSYGRIPTITFNSDAASAQRDVKFCVAAGRRGRNGGSNAIGLLPNRRPPGACRQDHEGDASFFQVLLMTNPSIGREQQVCSPSTRAQAVALSRSIWRSHRSNWCQLVTMRLTMCHHERAHVRPLGDLIVQGPSWPPAAHSIVYFA
jgi:hypothetical protein